MRSRSVTLLAYTLIVLNLAGVAWFLGEPAWLRWHTRLQIGRYRREEEVSRIVARDLRERAYVRYPAVALAIVGVQVGWMLRQRIRRAREFTAAFCGLWCVYPILDVCFSRNWSTGTTVVLAVRVLFAIVALNFLNDAPVRQEFEPPASSE